MHVIIKIYKGTPTYDVFHIERLDIMTMKLNKIDGDLLTLAGNASNG